MSRWLGTIGVVLLLGGVTQIAGQEPPERIDLLEQSREAAKGRSRVVEDCPPEDVDIVSQTITVCRRLRDDTDEFWDKEAWESDYARRTQGAQPVSTFGIPEHGTVVGRGCFIPPCPPPPALIIDVEALPEAPPGSDAERVGQGLTPTGNEAGDESGDEEVSPSGSASPEEQR